MGRTGCATTISGVFFVLLLTAGTCLASHPYHVSFAEVEWNAKSGNFEVALCVWPSDLEKALAAQEKKSIDLDKVENLDAMIEKYITQRFVVSSRDKGKVKSQCKLRWIGHEKDLKKAWLYFEVVSKDMSQFTFENKLFFELNEDQSNHVQLKNRGSISSFGFNASSSKHVFRLHTQN